MQYLRLFGQGENIFQKQKIYFFCKILQAHGFVYRKHLLPRRAVTETHAEAKEHDHEALRNLNDEGFDHRVFVISKGANLKGNC